MIIIFGGGGDIIVWGKLPSFSGWRTSPYDMSLSHAIYIPLMITSIGKKWRFHLKINDDSENIDL